MGKLFGFFFKVILLFIFLLACTAAIMIFDGLNDHTQKADVALVLGGSAPEKGVANPVLDRVVQMHRTGEITTALLISSKWQENGQEDASAMAKYLEAHGVPGSDILVNNNGGTLVESARIVAETMKNNDFVSVIVVAQYYDVTRLKLALIHEKLHPASVHVGTVRKEDAAGIASSLVALYDYIGKVYLVPGAEEVKKEAKVGLDKASVDAHEAKEKVDKSLDNLAK